MKGQSSPGKNERNNGFNQSPPLFFLSVALPENNGRNSRRRFDSNRYSNPIIPCHEYAENLLFRQEHSHVADSRRRQPGRRRSGRLPSKRFDPELVSLPKQAPPDATGLRLPDCLDDSLHYDGTFHRIDPFATNPENGYF